MQRYQNNWLITRDIAVAEKQKLHVGKENIFSDVNQYLANGIAYNIL